jgi:hypothetical protein
LEKKKKNEFVTKNLVFFGMIILEAFAQKYVLQLQQNNFKIAAPKPVYLFQ